MPKIMLFRAHLRRCLAVPVVIKNAVTLQEMEFPAKGYVTAPVQTVFLQEPVCKHPRPRSRRFVPAQIIGK